MLDPMFSFIDPIVEPIIELSEENVIPVEIFFDFLEEAGVAKKAACVLEGATLEIPLDVIMSLLRPDELERLRKYIAAYLAKHGGNEI